MSPKLQAFFSAVLTVLALAAAPVFAGGWTTADVVEINVPGFLPVIGPFIYFVAFVVAAALLGLKHKKSAGITMLAILTVCFIASALIVTAAYGTSVELPSLIKLFALPFIFLYSPASSLINGFVLACDIPMLAYSAVYLTPIVSMIVFAIGFKVGKKN